MRKFLLVSLLLVSAASPVLADHPAGIFAAVCEFSFTNPEAEGSKATRALCRNKVEGFADGYRFATSRLPGAQTKCYPSDNDTDGLLQLFIAHMKQHPDLASANYSGVLKQLIDSKFQCRTS